MDEKNHYYPFEMKMPGLCSVYNDPETKFTGGGKELEDDYNLNPLSDDGYHYGVRHYDPQLCRWQQVDPADEFHSPYVYCANNPANVIDPDGTTVLFLNDGSYKIIDDEIGIEKGAYEDDYKEKGMDAATINISFITLEDINNEIDTYIQPNAVDILSDNNLSFYQMAESFETQLFEGVGKPPETLTHYLVTDLNSWYRSDELNYIGIGTLYRNHPDMYRYHMHIDIFAWKLYKYWELPTKGVIFWANYGFDYRSKSAGE